MRPDPRDKRWPAVVLMLFVVPVFVFLVAAPKAVATPQGYIAQLESTGWFYGPVASYLDLGYKVCSDIAIGVPYDRTIANIIALHGDFSYVGATAIYAAAVDQLCPDVVEAV